MSESFMDSIVYVLQADIYSVFLLSAIAFSAVNLYRALVESVAGVVVEQHEMHQQGRKFALTRAMERVACSRLSSQERQH